MQIHRTASTRCRTLHLMSRNVLLAPTTAPIEWPVVCWAIPYLNYKKNRIKNSDFPSLYCIGFFLLFSSSTFAIPTSCSRQIRNCLTVMMTMIMTSVLKMIKSGLFIICSCEQCSIFSAVTVNNFCCTSFHVLCCLHAAFDAISWRSDKWQRK